MKRFSCGSTVAELKVSDIPKRSISGNREVQKSSFRPTLYQVKTNAHQQADVRFATASCFARYIKVT